MIWWQVAILMGLSFAVGMVVTYQVIKWAIIRQFRKNLEESMEGLKNLFEEDDGSRQG